LKVLHIWNTAGVASIIAKYQAKLLGWKTWVITRRQYDRFGLTVYGEAISCRARIFKLISLIKSLNYEIIHVHSLDEIIPLIKKILPWRKVIIHYHGSDIRGRWRERERYWSMADLVLVATPDLLENAPKTVTYLPNPVDTELFKPIPELRRPGTALYIVKHHEDEDVNWPRRVAEKLNLKLTIRDRLKEPIPYRELPKILNQFEYYIDRNYIKSLSKTALEALACKCKVVRWDEKVIEKLPEKHKPENVVMKLRELYEQIT